MIDNITFVKFDRQFLHKTFLWLSDSEIKYDTMAPSVTREDQGRWFSTLNHRTDYLIWGVLCDNVPIGVVGLKHIDYNANVAEYFGYVGEKQYWGHGIGKSMMSFAMGESKKLGLREVYLHVRKDNLRAIALYEHYGFKLVSEEIVDSKETVDWVRVRKYEIFLRP